jgi:nickel-dependent lactate racemase
MVPVEEPFDVVVTSNAGFPLDQNLYQCVKGMSAAAGVVRDGGRVLLAAECRDGFPDHGSYRELLASGSSPAELLEAIRARPAAQPDQWQVQVQAQIQLRARVGVHTSGLAAAELAAAHLEAVADLAGAVRAELDAAGPRARCCVLPEGPVTVPYLAAPELRL